jgi:hypothetical protein
MSAFWQDDIPANRVLEIDPWNARIMLMKISMCHGANPYTVLGLFRSIGMEPVQALHAYAVWCEERAGTSFADFLLQKIDAMKVH